MSYIETPLSPEACGECGGCRASNNDPWSCNRPWNVGKLLGPLKTFYDPATGLKKSAKGFSSRALPLDYDSGSTYKSGGKGYTGYSTTNGNGGYEKCAHSHPALVIQEGFTVYGGAASSPVVKDADIYVSLDSYSGGSSVKAYPWNPGSPMFICFPITDMQAPKDPAEFRKMIVWLKEQGLAGKKIHVGCIGGHGRTGTVLAALVKEVTGNVDAIAFVRKNYCQKAVESNSQVEFLAKEWGLTKVKGYKETYAPASKGYTVESPSRGSQTAKFNSRYGDLFRGSAEVTIPIDPVAKRGNIWGA